MSMNMENKNKDIKFIKFPAIIASIMLLLTFLDWPYGYSTLLRIIITGVAIYYAYFLYEIINKTGFWFWGLIVIAIFFNIIIPIYLYDKTVWGFIDIDIITAFFFVSLIIKFRK